MYQFHNIPRISPLDPFHLDLSDDAPVPSGHIGKVEDVVRVGEGSSRGSRQRRPRPRRQGQDRQQQQRPTRRRHRARAQEYRLRFDSSKCSRKKSRGEKVFIGIKIRDS